MEIKLEDQRIVELQATYTAEQIHGLALSKRVDAFGQVAKLFQRPKPDDIEVTASQKRLEPFWFASGGASYVYDRRHSYRIDVGPEVRSVTLLGKDFAVADGPHPSFEADAVDHCHEEAERELLVDATRGEETPDLRKYLKYQATEIADLAALEHDEALVVAPGVRSSFVVRKLISLLMKTIQADVVNEERINVREVKLYYRPVFAVEYFWKSRDKRQVLEFDALTGDFKSDAAQIVKHAPQPIEAAAVFDTGTGHQEFHIDIDRAREEREVADITESDFFRDLQAKAKGMRPPSGQAQG